MIVPKVGDLIELIEMPDDPNPIAPGTKGTVNYVGKVATLGQQIGVLWEDGSTLMLVNGTDRFRIL